MTTVRTTNPEDYDNGDFTRRYYELNAKNYYLVVFKHVEDKLFHCQLVKMVYPPRGGVEEKHIQLLTPSSCIAEALFNGVEESQYFTNE